MERTLRAVLTLTLCLGLSGCLGTRVQSPAQDGQSFSTTNIHLIGASRMVDASLCRDGLASVTVFVPIWGVAVGILTFGILVPFTTRFTCTN